MSCLLQTLVKLLLRSVVSSWFNLVGVPFTCSLYIYFAFSAAPAPGTRMLWSCTGKVRAPLGKHDERKESAAKSAAFAKLSRNTHIAREAKHVVVTVTVQAPMLATATVIALAAVPTAIPTAQVPACIAAKAEVPVALRAAALAAPQTVALAVTVELAAAT
jgi:hypothetical protein